MSPPAGAVLVVAATDDELAPLLAALTPAAMGPSPAPPERARGLLEGVTVRLAVSGVGKSNAAWTAGTLLAREAARAVLQVGIGGAYPEAFVPVGAAVCALEERDLDAGLLGRDGPQGMAALGFPLWTAPDGRAHFDRFPCDDGWTARLAAACGAPPLPFATSDAVSADLDVAQAREARSGAAVESMEGAAVAQACLRANVAFAELRGVSNVAGQRDPGTWEARGAIHAATRALRQALRRAASA